VEWRTLVDENHILFSNMPPQLIYFNRQISGLAEWPGSFWYTVSGLGMFVLWAGVIVMVGALLVRKQDAGWRNLATRGAWMTGAGLIWWALIRTLFDVRGDANPLTCMPIVLVFLIIALGWRVWRMRAGLPVQTGTLLLLSVFALVSILRVILKVKVTGPYVPFFIPSVIVIITFLLLSFLPTVAAPPGILREGVSHGAMIIVALLVVGMAIGSIVRLRRHNTFEMSSPRGTFMTLPEIGVPLSTAINYVRLRVAPDDYVLPLPLGTTINFLAERAYPFREEIVHPGFLSDDEAIQRLEERPVPLILVLNVSTHEFRDRVFGVDYNPGLLRWIEKHYRVAARFDSSESRGAQPGDAPFFILAYERSR
jgi:hypothetical protein